MDGVLIDSEPLHFVAYERLIANLGGLYSHEMNNQFLGKKDSEIAPLVVDTFNLPMSPEEFVRQKDHLFHNLIKENPVCLPGVTATLETALALNLKTGLASSSKMTTIEVIVDALKIKSYFHNLTSGDEVKNGKPAPDVFLLSANRMETAPQHCLVIEDTENGVRAAKNAGMFCVAIPCEATRFQKHEEACLKLNSMEELDLESLLNQ